MENLKSIVFEELKKLNEKVGSKIEGFYPNNVIDDIVLIAIGGSSLFKETPKDLDLIVVVNNFELKYARTYTIIDEKVYDIFIFDKEVYKKTIEYKTYLSQSTFLSVGYYLYNIVFGEFWFDYNILDYSKEAKKRVSSFLINTFFKKERFEKLNYAVPQLKKMWWHYLETRFLENQSYVVTEEDKQKMERWYAGNIIEEDINFWKQFLKENKKIDTIVEIFVKNNFPSDTLN